MQHLYHLAAFSSYARLAEVQHEHLRGVDPYGSCSMGGLYHGSLSDGHIQLMDFKVFCRRFGTHI
jgi:hypothetical protein